MPRNLDLTALRSFVAVADARGVTKAAAQLNLTQSAVSMQLKRLEETLGQSLLDRSGRQVTLTQAGDQLLGYARSLVNLNDEAWGRMTNTEYEGELNFGVPYDVVYPHVPKVLQRFTAEYPRVRVHLHSLYTSHLKERFDRGEIDLILTTEASCDAGGLTLARAPLVWVGAVGGQAWRARPIKFAAVSHCIFRRPAIEALEQAGVPWINGVDSISDIAVEATVSADLGVFVQLETFVPKGCEAIRHGGALPTLPKYQINLYRCDGPRADMAERLATFVRQAYGVPDSLAVA
ncbi:MAG: LysR family transcriptional regulator [Pseudomonadota bacterium]